MLYLWLIIILVGGDILIDNETLLVINFINLKIKSTQSFRGIHKDIVCVCVHRDDCTYVYEYLHFYCDF
jgi:hypothetical protein